MLGEQRLTRTEGQEQDEVGDLYYDEGTLKRVYDAMAVSGVTGDLATGIVNNMQGLGILFRQRGKF